jgi:hypothetical protein
VNLEEMKSEVHDVDFFVLGIFWARGGDEVKVWMMKW